MRVIHVDVANRERVVDPVKDRSSTPLRHCDQATNAKRGARTREP
jgi:hypothetical protein